MLISRAARLGLFFYGNDVEDYQDIVSVGGVSSWDGSYNLFIDNHIDGHWDGHSPAFTQGADDGIVLGYEHDDQISNNTIQNTWDAGVESIGTLSNTLIWNNHFVNIHYGAVASYINTNWENNLIENNQVMNATYLVEVTFSALPAYGAVPPTIVFHGNQIENNIFSSPRSADADGVYARSMIILITDAPTTGSPIPIVADNNVITGNILPIITPGPMLMPATAFIDGGGNVCGPVPAGSPIVCDP